MVKYFQNKGDGLAPRLGGAGRLVWDLRLINLLLIVGTSLLFVGYLAMNNQAAANGFTIRSLERRVGDLEEQRKKLDMDLLGRQSMQNVEDQVKGLGFVPVQAVDYLQAVDGVVAVR